MTIDGSAYDSSGSVSHGVPKFGPREAEEAVWLLRRAVSEDMPAGDATTDPLFGGDGPTVWFDAEFVAREAGVLSGVPVVEALFRENGPEIELQTLRADGDKLAPGEVFLRAKAPAAALHVPLRRSSKPAPVQ